MQESLDRPHPRYDLLRHYSWHKPINPAKRLPHFLFVKVVIGIPLQMRITL